ncbi:hypothetical protein HAX54_033570 [Datura stramonium]|uniref:F-box domain-containing protein n=1 Tax=Datura stramonium TaxID=4076 RepID=A0ABS8SDF7_DATST|nr:hypothetical protein [Datura stramonium]
MATSDNDRRPFPEDLAMKILPRLPVESLLRFKCVSKKWYEVIKSPDFMRKHLNWSSKKKIPKILIYDHAGCPEIDAHIPPNPNPITLISVSDAPAVVLVPDYLQEFRGMTFLLGSIDGLFLLEREIYGSIFLALWNPATREARSLLSPNFELQKEISNDFGFGLDTMTNDYKVVWFQSPYFSSEEPPPFQPTVSVYSCSRDSWSILQPENGEILRYRREALGTAYLNGAYYMLAFRTTHHSILSFDFGSEVLAEIRLPDDPRPFYGWELELTLLDDSIAIFTNIEKFYYTMWVMIQPGAASFRSINCSNSSENGETGSLKDALTGMVDERVEELLNREENRVLLDGLEKATQRVEIAKKQLAEIQRQELEAKLLKDYITQLETRTSEIAECQKDILEARAMIEEAERSLSVVGDTRRRDASRGTDRDVVNRDEERVESIKAASLSAIVGTLAGLPISLSRITSNSELILPLSITFISCALFGVTFRYAVRRDLDNFQLKSGTSAAFGVVKGLATLGDGPQLELDAASFWSHALDAAVYVSENLLIFLFAGVGLDLCFKLRILSPFPIDRSISETDKI